GMIVALSAKGIGQFAAGQIGIAAPDQHQVAGQPAVLVERARGFYRGAELVVRPDQRQRRCRREQLGIRSRGEQLVGVLGIKDLTGWDCDNLNAPKSAVEVWRRKNRGNTFLERLLLCGLGVDGQQETQKCRELRTSETHGTLIDCSTGTATGNRYGQPFW